MDKGAKYGCILDNRRTNVEEDVNLTIIHRYRRLCPKLVRLASRAANIEETFALIEKMIEEFRKEKKNEVEDIATKNVASHQLPHRMSLCSSNENLDPN